MRPPPLLLTPHTPSHNPSHPLLQDKSNEELLMLYGFAVPGNPHDHAMLACPVPPSAVWDDVMHARMETLQARRGGCHGIYIRKEDFHGCSMRGAPSSIFTAASSGLHTAPIGDQTADSGQRGHAGVPRAAVGRVGRRDARAHGDAAGEAKWLPRHIYS